MLFLSPPSALNSVVRPALNQLNFIRKFHISLSCIGDFIFDEITPASWRTPVERNFCPSFPPLASGCLTFSPGPAGRPTDRTPLAAERRQSPLRSPHAASPRFLCRRFAVAPFSPSSLEPSTQWVANRRMSKTCNEIDDVDEKTLEEEEVEE